MCAHKFYEHRLSLIIDVHYDSVLITGNIENNITLNKTGRTETEISCIDLGIGQTRRGKFSLRSIPIRVKANIQHIHAALGVAAYAEDYIGSHGTEKSI